MTQNDRLDYLIDHLIKENDQYKYVVVPNDTQSKKQLLRSLMNVRNPVAADELFLKIQDEYLRLEIKERGTVSINDIRPSSENIYLWQGDITTIEADAIVNAANSQMLGCFVPCHGCIDNAIHTYAGIQLRLACYELMKEQGRPEETGKAKITPAFNLPSKYVIHTVGPIISGKLSVADCELLKSCYVSCMDIAAKNDFKSIAFCCTSTGEFHFPNDIAAEIAVNTVKKYLRENKSEMKVIFNVFKDEDYRLYNDLLR